MHEHGPPNRDGVLVRYSQAGPAIQAARDDGPVLVAIELEATDIGGRDRLTANFLIPRHCASAAHPRGGPSGRLDRDVEIVKSMTAGAAVINPANLAAQRERSNRSRVDMVATHRRNHHAAGRDFG